MSRALGVSVAVTPLYDTVAATGPVGPVSVKVDALIVAASIGSENVAVTGTSADALAAPSDGHVISTRGGGSGGVGIVGGWTTGVEQTVAGVENTWRVMRFVCVMPSTV